MREFRTSDPWEPREGNDPGLPDIVVNRALRLLSAFALTACATYSLEDVFTSVVQITTVECGYCTPYDNHKPIYVARGVKRSWAGLWAALACKLKP